MEKPNSNSDAPAAVGHGMAPGKLTSHRSPRFRGLVVSGTFPSANQPIHGVFVKERIRHVAALPDYEVSVVAATPYFPPIKQFKRWHKFSTLPRTELVDGLNVYRPRYILPPKIGGLFHPQLMMPAVRRGLKHFGGAHSFDFIDAHFAYPDGVAGAWLAEETGLPLVITCRGSDIVKIPEIPLCRKPIEHALSVSTRIVTVSEEIRSLTIGLGADPSKIDVIPNGVDTQKFRPLNREQSRTACGLPLDAPVIVSVGYLMELKGFHILIEAASRLLSEYPNLMVAIVGGTARWGEDYSREIRQVIDRCGMQDHVLLAGPRPQTELLEWYSSADLFALLSSREGSPNVLMEALACGTPAVTTPVGGIPDLLSNKHLGQMVSERTPEAVTDGLRQALQKPWNRVKIREIMEGKNWNSTASQVDTVFKAALERR